MATRSASSQKLKVEATSAASNALEYSATATSSLAITLLEQTLTSGVSANQANRFWEYKGIELTSGASTDVDLYAATGIDVGAGSGDDALGQALDMEEVVALIVHKTGGTGTLDINATLPTNPVGWIPQYAARNAVGGALKTDGVRIWMETDTDGLDLSSTSKNVRFTAVGGSVEFSIYVMGRHDDDESSSSSQSSSSSSSSSASSSSSSTSSTSSSS